MGEAAAAAEAIDWPGLFRRAGAGAQRALERSPDLTATAGPGAGGDVSLAIDRAVEDVVFAELEALGTGLTAISEERGEVHLRGGGPVHVVIDPIDGSRNAARGSKTFSLSIAVADGPRMRHVRHAFVRDLGGGEEFSAQRGRGARLDGHPLPRHPARETLEIVGIESAHPRLVAAHSAALVDSGAKRVRGLGSVALSLCQVAAGRFDGAVCLAPTRSVDCAAGQLIVLEAGGAVAFPEAEGGPDDAALSLDMRSRVVAVGQPSLLGRLAPVGATG